MKLKDAFVLLHENGTADHHRNFAMIFKHYNFTEDKDLKDYLDFIDHETLEWIKGFPAGMITKEQLAKAKTALIKLLKLQEVRTALGEEYVAKVHRKVWDTFKQNIDSIVQERAQTLLQRQTPAESFTPWEPQSHPLTEEDISPPYISERFVHCVRPLRAPNMPTVTTTPTHSVPSTQQNSQNGQENQENRIKLLKEVIGKMADLLPAGASDAFRLLVSHV
jgi:hypothetical protein